MLPLPRIIPTAIIAIVCALLVAVVAGCNGDGHVDADGNGTPPVASFEAERLARDLLADDRTRQSAAVEEVAAATRENQQRVTSALDGRGLTADVSAELGRRAASTGRYRMAAEWYAWPQNPPASDEARIERRLLVIEQLIEAGETDTALQLCDSRLTGEYAPDVEARFSALRDQALARAE